MTAKILIVDDVAINTRLLSAKLKAEYYSVNAVFNAFDALEMAARWQPDIILLDIMMPGMDGFECCRRLKENKITRYIPVVMLTALSEVKERVCGLKSGADEFLTKPVDHFTLLLRIKSLIKLKRVFDEWRVVSDTATAFGIDRETADDSGQTGFQVLIADDDTDNHAAMLSSLAMHNVKVAATLEQSQIGLSDISNLDLVILNLNLAYRDPLSIIAQIRVEQQSQHLPILGLFEDNLSRSSLVMALDLGLNDWIKLPVETAEFNLRCRNLILRKSYHDRMQTHIDRAIQLVALDPLTGLYNRRYLEKHLEAFLNEPDRELSILMIDIDHFKAVNDRYGHIFGDSIIRLVAKTLLANTRSFDTVSRFGGEEFVVLLPDTSQVQALRIADRLLGAIRAMEIFADQDHSVALTVSIGLASSSKNGKVGKPLLEATDKALYQAKFLGRDQVFISREATPSESPLLP